MQPFKDHWEYAVIGSLIGMFVFFPSISLLMTIMEAVL